jgi:hypothetical protein
MAIGSCKSCQKGLCRTCAVDVGKGLACPACETDVRAINEMVARNITLSRSMSAAAREAVSGSARLIRLDTWFYYVAGVLFAVVGIIMLATELSSDNPLGVSGKAMSVLVILFGVVMGVMGIRRRAAEPDPKKLDTPE